MAAESPIEIAERQWREMEEAIDRQEKILREPRHDGHPTHAAEALLAVFRSTLRTHEQTLDLLRRSQPQV